MRCVSLASAVALAGACASSEPSDGALASEDALVNGTVATDRMFPAVFAWTDGEDLRGSYCTATKIAPRFFITAAHCVLYQEETPGHWYAGAWKRSTKVGAAVRYTFERRMTEATRGETLEVAAVHLPPALEACLTDRRRGSGCTTGRAPTPDVAVVEVVRSRGSFTQGATATLGTDFVAAGEPFTMLGYGSTRENDTSPPALRYRAAEVASSAALRRALEGTEAELDGPPDETYLFGSLGVLVSTRYSNLGSGDSGGPVFAAGTSKIIGINSDGYCPRTNRSCQRTTQSEFARIDIGSAHGVGEWLQELFTP